MKVLRYLYAIAAALGFLLFAAQAVFLMIGAPLVGVVILVCLGCLAAPWVTTGARREFPAAKKPAYQDIESPDTPRVPTEPLVFNDAKMVDGVITDWRK